MKRIDTEIAILGAGPAGLAVANDLQRAGYQVVLFDKRAVGGAIEDYPTFLNFFSTKDLLEIDGFPITIANEKPSRREYLVYLHRFAKEKNLDVRPYHEARRVHAPAAGDEESRFRIELESMRDGAVEATARYVVVATGAWDRPSLLGVPGEDLPKVSHRYREAFPYIGRKVMVIGGRNSAIEVALELWRSGVHVDLSYRRKDFTGAGVKYWLAPDIENRLANNEIVGHLGTVPVEIRRDAVRLREVETGREYDVENDFVLCMTGYRPDTALLVESGVQFNQETRVPIHDPETFESNVPGLFLAGVMLQGSVSGRIFIENSRHHGGNVLAGVRKREAERAAAAGA